MAYMNPDSSGYSFPYVHSQSLKFAYSLSQFSASGVITGIRSTITATRMRHGFPALFADRKR
jgi:hypothetical protein